MLEYLQNNAIQIAWFCFAVLMFIMLKMDTSFRNWLSTQFEWVKQFFLDDDTNTQSPSHKTLLVIGLTIVFCIAFLKKIITADAIPDIPTGWQIVLLGGLGITSAKSVLSSITGSTKSNG